MVTGDAARQQIEQLVLYIRDLVRSDEELQHLLQLVKENHLLARASPRPVPDEALLLLRVGQTKRVEGRARYRQKVKPSESETVRWKKQQKVIISNRDKVKTKPSEGK